MVPPFEGLTYLGQVRRLSRLARQALSRFGITEARLRLIQHAENTTFRVDTTQHVGEGTAGRPYVDGRFLLRVHRCGYQSRGEIRSELAWLRGLQDETGLSVPAPVPTREGEGVVEVTTETIPDGRCCSLLRWMDGRCYGENPTRRRAERLGKITAILHRHARAWKPPEQFDRRRWDHHGLLGDGGGFGMPVAQILERLSDERREIAQEISRRAAQGMSVLDRSRGADGLIHADLHLGNVLFAKNGLRVIDFDDCGFGHWIYDLAVPVADWIDREDGEYLRDALLEGYQKEGTLPAEQIAQLDVYAATRLVSLAFWTVGRTADHPRFRERSERWLTWCLRYPKRFLGL